VAGAFDFILIGGLPQMKMKRLSQDLQDVLDYFQRRNTKWTYFLKN
jgi:hypothetical protein